MPAVPQWSAIYKYWNTRQRADLFQVLTHPNSLEDKRSGGDQYSSLRLNIPILLHSTIYK